MENENCPQCGQKTTILQSSGRIICRSCGWSKTSQSQEQPQSDVLTHTKDVIGEVKEAIGSFIDRSINSEVNNLKKTPQNHEKKPIFAPLLFTFGLFTMVVGLGMDTTVCGSYGLDCTHNIGKLNTRSNVVNFGGFSAVCGAILISQIRKERD